MPHATDDACSTRIHRSSRAGASDYVVLRIYLMTVVSQDDALSKCEPQLFLLYSVLLWPLILMYLDHDVHMV